MNILNGKIKKVYIKYLASAFGSTLIPCVYSAVDMVAVGNYQGPDGPAALAVFAPVWNIVYGLGLLVGIGGSVLFGNLKGSDESETKRANMVFSSSVIFAALLSVALLFVLIFFSSDMLVFFGADENILSLTNKYLLPIIFVFPFFIFNQVLAAFLRNDSNPILATKAVLFGGIFNVVGDYFFVFTLNMGIFGAGLATAIGSVLTFFIMLTHFMSKKNTMCFVFPKSFLRNICDISSIGFSTFITDVAMGVLTVIFNKQIIKYFDNNALSVYGIIVNISTFVTCCAYSVGQASQPIISMNYGAGKYSRISECLRYAIYTAFGFGIIWTTFGLACPEFFVNVFMTPTKEVLSISPHIIRSYSLSFLILPFNVFSTYYFQSILKPNTALVISILRGILISGALIIVIPLLFNADALWYSMLISEFLVFLYVIIKMRRFKSI